MIPTFQKLFSVKRLFLHVSRSSCQLLTDDLASQAVCIYAYIVIPQQIYFVFQERMWLTDGTMKSKITAFKTQGFLLGQVRSDWALSLQKTAFMLRNW